MKTINTYLKHTLSIAVAMGLSIILLSSCSNNKKETVEEKVDNITDTMNKEK